MRVDALTDAERERDLGREVVELGWVGLIAGCACAAGGDGAALAVLDEPNAVPLLVEHVALFLEERVRASLDGDV